jgi:hypothetical protein
MGISDSIYLRPCWSRPTAFATARRWKANVCNGSMLSKKGLRTAPNSDSADSEDHLAGGSDDGAADWRPGESVL